MRIQRPCHGIYTGLFSSKVKKPKKDKTYEYHKKITIISEEHVKSGSQEHIKRNIKYIEKDSKGARKG